jgi:hypothetical protein
MSITAMPRIWKPSPRIVIEAGTRVPAPQAGLRVPGPEAGLRVPGPSCERRRRGGAR